MRLLSLDASLPFCEAMGLRVPAKPALLSVARDLVRFGRDEHGAGPLPPTFVEHAMRELELRLGEEVRDHLVDWVTNVFEQAPSDHPHRNAWAYILAWCAGNAGSWDRLGLPASLSSRLLAEYRATTADQDVYDLYRQEQAKPVSEWDAEARRRGEFDDDCLDPFTFIVNAVNASRFERALSQLLAPLSESEIAVLCTNAQAIGLAAGLTRIADLAHPQRLKESTGA